MAQSRRHKVSAKGVLITAGVALLVVLGYDKYKSDTTGPVAGARPGSIA